MSDQINEENQDTLDGIVITCTYCKLRCHKTTPNYKPGIMNGTYLDLIREYGKDGMNWYDFPHNEHCIGDNVMCPRCGNGYDHVAVFQEVQEVVAYRKLNFIGVTDVEKQDEEDQKAQAANEGKSVCIRSFYGESESGVGNTEIQEDYIDNNSTFHDFRGPCDDSNAAIEDACDFNVALSVEPVLSDGERKIYDMTCEGRTQQQIAEACNMTLYAVRQIQKQLFKR